MPTLNGAGSWFRCVCVDIPANIQISTFAEINQLNAIGAETHMISLASIKVIQMSLKHQNRGQYPGERPKWLSGAMVAQVAFGARQDASQNHGVAGSSPAGATKDFGGIKAIPLAFNCQSRWQHLEYPSLAVFCLEMFDTVTYCTKQIALVQFIGDLFGYFGSETIFGQYKVFLSGITMMKIKRGWMTFISASHTFSAFIFNTSYLESKRSFMDILEITELTISGESSSLVDVKLFPMKVSFTSWAASLFTFFEVSRGSFLTAWMQLRSIVSAKWGAFQTIFATLKIASFTINDNRIWKRSFAQKTNWHIDHLLHSIFTNFAFYRTELNFLSIPSMETINML